LSLKLKDIVGNIFHTNEKAKAEEVQKTANLQQTANNVFGTSANTLNPFLKKNGELLNPLLNYQKFLDNPNISQKAKQYITQATGLTPTVTEQKTVTPSTSGAYTPSGNTVQTTKASATGNTIADAAQKYIGTPYVWGGESMTEGGMDCSGFVYNALKDAGYDVGRTTAQGYRSYGKTVGKADMQPGDLIFFGKNNNDASHIGIYIGNGQMIHSSGGSKNTKANPGKGVSITNVDYRSDFLEARRY
jgi:cell wall-associated NlpC family hydrolase